MVNITRVRMMLQQTLLVIIIFLCSVNHIESRSYSERDLGSSSSISYSNSKKPKMVKQQQHAQEVATTTGSVMNLCSKDRDMKLVCHCTPEDYIHIKASKADCWIFHDDFPRKDTNWLAFHTQIYLEHLKFTVQRTGRLDYVPTDVIATLKYLKVLSIEYAQINELHSYAFTNLTQIQRISLPKNQIRVLYPYAFANHPDLEEINLEQNQITEIDRHAFVDLPNLTQLNLSKNNLTTVHDDVFNELRKLIELRLDSNSISVLTREMFKGLGNLKSLRVSQNNINFIGDAVFTELWGLSELELDNNNIEKLSERAFDGLNVLKTLNLAHNKLMYLEPNVFVGVTAIVLLDLSNNQLETVTQHNIQPLLDNLVNSTSVLELTGNRLTCDCRLRWVFDLSKNTKNEGLRESLHRIQCVLVSKNDHENDNLFDGVENTIQKHPHSLHDTDIIESYDDYQDVNYGADVEASHVRIGSGQLSALLKLKPEQLPCPLTEPTELPLQRESIGFMGDLVWKSSGNSYVVSQMGSFILSLTAFCVVVSLQNIF